MITEHPARAAYRTFLEACGNPPSMVEEILRDHNPPGSVEPVVDTGPLVSDLSNGTIYHRMVIGFPAACQVISPGDWLVNMGDGELCKCTAAEFAAEFEATK